MEAANSNTYDLFLSYSRKDEAFVKKLHADLEQRGVVAYLDQFDIGPGVLFEEAIFSDIAKSRAYGLVVSGNSLTSSWVQREYSYARKLFDGGQIRMFPLLCEARLPQHPLASHNGLPFWNPTAYQENLNRLIFPGITGKEISVLVINSYVSNNRKSNRNLDRGFARYGINAERVGSTFRALEVMQDYLEHCLASQRLVVAIDLFDETERMDHKVEFVFKYRELTRAKPREIVFLLIHESPILRAFAKSTQALGVDTRKRLNHYFQLRTDLGERQFNHQLDIVRASVQRELMRVRD